MRYGRPALCASCSMSCIGVSGSLVIINVPRTFSLSPLGSAIGVQVTAALFAARLARDGFLPAFHTAFLGAGAVCAAAVVLALLPGGAARATGALARPR